LEDCLKLEEFWWNLHVRFLISPSALKHGKEKYLDQEKYSTNWTIPFL